MKNAILLHGTGCKPDYYWFPSIIKHLKNRGYSVSAPNLPNSDTPDLKKSLPFILSNEKFSKDTILIGHSSGCPLILSILENLNVKISKAILVAGFARQLKDGKRLILQDKYDWDKIKKNVDEIIFINSDDDPWGCNDIEGRYMFDNLGGIQIIMHNQGHFGSGKFNQLYKKFKLLENLLP
jgi:hypothetical protein